LRCVFVFGVCVLTASRLIISSASSSCHGSSGRPFSAGRPGSARRPTSASTRVPSTAPSMTGSASSMVRHMVESTLEGAAFVGAEMADSRPQSG